MTSTQRPQHRQGCIMCIRRASRSRHGRAAAIVFRSATGNSRIAARTSDRSSRRFLFSTIERTTLETLDKLSGSIGAGKPTALRIRMIYAAIVRGQIPGKSARREKEIDLLTASWQKSIPLTSGTVFACRPTGITQLRECRVRSYRLLSSTGERVQLTPWRQGRADVSHRFIKWS